METRAGGLIAYLGLSIWWFETFTDDERAEILRQVDRPFSAFSEMDFVCNLAGWFTGSDLRQIGRKIAISAEARLVEIQNPFELHFALAVLIDFWERTGGRHNQNADRELPLCRKQVGIADAVAPMWLAQFNDSPLPQHTGFRRLLELLDRDRDAAEITLLKEAIQRSGWRVN